MRHRNASEHDRRYYQRHKERLKAKVSEYYYSHKEQRIAYAMKYQNEHKTQKYRYNEKYRKKLRVLLLEILGNKCVICGTLERIEIDHINAGGTKDRIFRGNNWDMYRYYQKHPEEAKEKLQLLCKSHNRKKQTDNHEWY